MHKPLQSQQGSYQATKFIANDPTVEENLHSRLDPLAIWLGIPQTKKMGKNLSRNQNLTNNIGKVKIVTNEDDLDMDLENVSLAQGSSSLCYLISQ